MLGHWAWHDSSFPDRDINNGDKNKMLKSFDKIKGISIENVFSGHGEESTKEEQVRNLNLYRRFLTR